MFSTVLFYIFSVVLVIAAVRVILARHPIIAALHLILTFFTSAMLWLLIGAEFLGLILVVVYIGAVMVLFLFIVMMIDVEPESINRNFRTYLPIGLVIGAVMVLEISFVFVSSYLDSGSFLSTPEGYNNTFELGKAMYTQYSFPIQVGAILLLVGMISAIAISLRGRKQSKYTNVSKQLKVKPSDRLRVVKMASETQAEPEQDNKEEAKTEQEGGKQ